MWYDVLGFWHQSNVNRYKAHQKKNSVIGPEQYSLGEKIMNGVGQHLMLNIFVKEQIQQQDDSTAVVIALQSLHTQAGKH